MCLCFQSTISRIRCRRLYFGYLNCLDLRLQEDPRQTGPLRLDGDRVSQDGRVQSQVGCLELRGHSLGDIFTWKQALRIR